MGLAAWVNFCLAPLSGLLLAVNLFIVRALFRRRIAEARARPLLFIFYLETEEGALQPASKGEEEWVVGGRSVCRRGRRRPGWWRVAVAL